MTANRIEKAAGAEFGDRTPAADQTSLLKRPPHHQGSGPSMTKTAKAQYQMRVQIMDKGEPIGLPITVEGRLCWALRKLIEAGAYGCTPINHPGPRWSHYTWRLRGMGFAIETIHEKHGGPFPGTHARYVLRSEVSVLEDVKVAA